MMCENISLDDRPASEIQIDGFIVLDLEQTECFAWMLFENETEYQLVNRGKGNGGIDYVYENNALVKPKPQLVAEEQPVSEGTQTL